MPIRSVLSMLAMLLTLTSQTLSADQAAVATMANIVIQLKHFPSDADQAALASIVESAESNDAEKQIATAISNIEHKAKPADRENLAAIIADDGASVSVRARNGGPKHQPCG